MARLRSAPAVVVFLLACIPVGNVHAWEDDWMDTPLHKAVHEDDSEAVHAAISASEGDSLNQRGPGGQTPLMLGCLMGKARAVKVLLEAGADVTMGEKDGYTPMHGAAFQGRPEVAKILIDHGLDPKELHTDGFSPMHRACWGSNPRHTETVKVFLEAGVPYDLPSRDGVTPARMVKGNKGTEKLLRRWANKMKKKMAKEAEEAAAIAAGSEEEKGAATVAPSSEAEEL